MFNCNFKSSKEKKSYYQHKKLEMLNYIKDSLERKIASVTASIEVLESQINRDKDCLLYTSPSPRDSSPSRMPSSA